MRHTILKLATAFFVGVAPWAGLSAYSTPDGGAHRATHAGSTSTATPIFERQLPDVPGKSLLAVEVLYPPGGASPSHRHPSSAFIYAYVVSGEVVSAVDDEKPRTYRAGEGFYEAPGAFHRVSRNASRTRPAKLLAVFVKNSGEGELVLPASE
jgi:quercetin dioxygenase-like cupin family protein